VDFIALLSEHSTVGKLFSSVLLVATVAVAHRFAAAAIRHAEWPTPETRRRWLVMARNVAILLALFLLVVLWAAQLRTLALSVVGFAMAIVLVTKELIMCVTGGFLRSSMGSFSIGDRIEVKNIRGDVIDLTMLTTTILEIGPEKLTHQYTGRAVVLPNSVFLTEPVVNESFTEDYVLHTIAVPLSRKDDWRRAEQLLLRAANEVCGQFMVSARRHIERIGRRQGIDVPSVDPRVTLQLHKPDEITLLVRFPAPAKQKGRTEQEILRRYLEFSRAAEAQQPAPPAETPQA
jgi:Small-conductance mechanosensitive channel